MVSRSDTCPPVQLLISRRARRLIDRLAVVLLLVLAVTSAIAPLKPDGGAP